MKVAVGVCLFRPILADLSSGTIYVLAQRGFFNE